MIETFLNKYKKVFGVIFILGILCTVVPVIVGCGYTYLCEDDFSFEGGAKDVAEEYGSSFLGAAHRMAEYYNTNQGTYLFNFLVHYIRAYSRGDLPGFHLFMILNTVVFCLLLLYLLKLLARDNIAYLGMAFAVFAALFAMKNTAFGMEVFFWYTGSLNFLIELSLAFIAVSGCILYIRDKKTRFLVVSTVAAFLASGGSLNIVCASFAWLAAIVIIDRDEFMKNKKIIIPIIGAVVGAFINGIAPGNRVRSDEGLKEGHSTLFDGLRDTFTCIVIEDKELFTSLVFIFMLILLFVICVLFKVKILKEKVTILNLVIVLVGTWVARFFTMFPVSYGYHVDYMANMRTTSSYEIVAKLMYFLAVAVLAQFVSERLEVKADYAAVGVSALCLLLALILHSGIKNELKCGMSYLVYNDYKTGTLQEAYAAREYVLSALKLAEKDSDAIIYVEPFRKAGSAYGMGLGVDCEEIRNRSAAGLFDLHTVTVIYKE
ncbi:MAG: hypothetical protein J5802_03380 [Butyrivibrio sp.]|nr:hypothetical protein [Butyrivibrio sp.]